MSQRMNDKKRLLESLEYIDDGMLSDTLSRVKTDVIDAGRQPTAKKHIAWVKQIAAVAACSLLLGALIPAVNLILPRLGVVSDGSAGAGDNPDQVIENTYTEGYFTYIVPYGEVPEQFQTIVEQNTFYNVSVFGDMLVAINEYAKLDEGEDGDTYILFKIYNYSGEKIGEKAFERNVYGGHAISIPTSDGNILSVFGGGPVYPTPGNAYYPPTRIVKFDSDGNILLQKEVDSSFDLELSSFKYGFETEGGFVFVGTRPKDGTPKTKMQNVITITFADHDLSVAKTLIWDKGDLFNGIKHVGYTDGSVMVYAYATFSASDTSERYTQYYKLTIDKSRNISKETEIEEDGIPTTRDIMGIYYDRSNLSRARHYVFIEYDDFDLLVSHCGTGTVPDLAIGQLASSYAVHPYLLYNETVYAAYSKDGELLWRIGVDANDHEWFEEYIKDYEEHVGPVVPETQAETE